MGTFLRCSVDELLGAYGQLDLAPGAEESVVRAAFKAKSKRHHPDSGGTHEAFLALEAALHVITQAAFPDAPAIAGAQQAEATASPTSATPSGAASSSVNMQPTGGTRPQARTVDRPGPRHSAHVRAAPKGGPFRTWSIGREWEVALEADVDTTYAWVLDVVNRAASNRSSLMRAMTGGLSAQLESRGPNHTWVRFKIREGIDAGWLDVDLAPLRDGTLVRWTLWSPWAEGQSKFNVRATHARLSEAMLRTDDVIR